MCRWAWSDPTSCASLGHKCHQPLPSIHQTVSELDAVYRTVPNTLLLCCGLGIVTVLAAWWKLQMLLEYIPMAFGCTVDYTEDWHSRKIALERRNKGLYLPGPKDSRLCGPVDSHRHTHETICPGWSKRDCKASHQQAVSHAARSSCSRQAYCSDWRETHTDQMYY